MVLDASRRARLHEVLFRWWKDARLERDRLPWRSTRDPWQVLVSETMLTQTQAERVASRYPAFIQEFPTVSSCAGATSAAVLRAWSGLGYNRRGMTLHQSARRIVAEHNGHIPAELESLLDLPGVGPYTARAVRAFAFEQPAAVVDTNIGRVLARAVAGRPLTRREAQELADNLVPDNAIRDWNLALMDLGSLVCRSKSPTCGRCPLGQAGECAWRQRDAPGGGVDPCRGSAAVSGSQARFEGSARQLRGRIVRAACEGPIARSRIIELAGASRAAAAIEQVLTDLLAEGLLLEQPGDLFCLPGEVFS
ncbi:MAG: mutY [Acidimicrobiaceae bacterium]|nr:mutY [Acidimicrobiaceae bacterium]